MSLSHDTLRQIQALVRPLSRRVANSIARAVVQLADDSAKLQVLQLGVLAGESVDDAERLQEYGFTSVPLAGAEAVVLFPNGDRAHPLVVAVDDRRYRPTGLQPGEVAMYNNVVATLVLLTENGDVEIRPAAGREVFVRSAGGAVDALVTQGEFERHTHVTAGTGAPVGPTPLAGGPLTYTAVLKAE